MTTIDALSYYDNTVVPGTTYEYTHQTDNSDGVLSTPASLFLTTPRKTPTINTTNALSLLQQVAPVTNGRQFGKELSDVYTSVSDGNQENLLASGFTWDSSEYDSTLTRYLSCDQEGQFSINNNQSSLPSYSGEFQHCASMLFGGETINGNYELRQQLSKYIYNTGINSDLTLDELVTTGTDGKLRTFKGLYSSFGGRLAQETVDWSDDYCCFTQHQTMYMAIEHTG